MIVGDEKRNSTVFGRINQANSEGWYGGEFRKDSGG